MCDIAIGETPVQRDTFELVSFCKALGAYKCLFVLRLDYLRVLFLYFLKLLLLAFVILLYSFSRMIAGIIRIVLE